MFNVLNVKIITSYPQSPPVLIGGYFLHVQLYICATYKRSWILWFLTSKWFLHVLRGFCVLKKGNKWPKSDPDTHFY